MEPDSTPLRIWVYVDASGRVPFSEWKGGLAPDEQALIERRIERLEVGNWGDWRPVGDGVAELRIHHGPGYRIYVGRQGLQAVLLLGGGDKSTQAKDIRIAQAHWADHRTRSRETRG
ncbi:MAG: type II toxin-antitoxin system RelE/ParE family toxin [Patescibacteria group bacterium]|nr:type II toxin-antitoxin system RelE/ParE family toxin [Patescibacteria group bacterium]